jgi:tetratricopeptide (TPR) repeat protein
MRILAALLLLLAAAPAQAFIFGKVSEGRAAAILAEMRAARDRGDCGAVIRHADGFLAEKPSAAMREAAYGCIGACYESLGLTDKAISLYKLAIELYPENTLFKSRLADIYNASGFHSNAAPLFLKVLAARSYDVQANLGLARAYAELGFYSRAKTYYSRAVVLQDFLDAAVLREYSAWMLKKRDWDEVMFIAGKGSAIEPRSAYWPLSRARASAGKGDHYKALPEIEAAIALEPSRQLRLERALYLLMGGLPRRAIAAAEPELAVNPADPLASAVKGMALYRLGERNSAKLYFEAARKGGPFTARLAEAFLSGGAAAAPETCKK